MYEKTKTLHALLAEGRAVLQSCLAVTTCKTSEDVNPDVAQLREYTLTLESKMRQLLQEKDDDDEICREIAKSTFAKNNAGRLYVALIDHAMGAKVDGLKKWWTTGNIQTRNGPGHWKLDPRTVRDKRGFNMLHMAVDRNLAKEKMKIELIELCIDVMGFDPNSVDLVS